MDYWWYFGMCISNIWNKKYYEESRGSTDKQQQSRAKHAKWYTSAKYTEYGIAKYKQARKARAKLGKVSACICCANPKWNLESKLSIYWFFIF